MEKRKASQLARYRYAENPMFPQSHVMKMTPEEHIERNMYIRQRIKGTSYEGCSDEAIDAIRFVDMPRGVYIDDGYEYVALNKLDQECANDRRSRARIPQMYAGMRADRFRFDIYEQDTSDMKKTINAFITNFEKFQDRGYGLYLYAKKKGTGKTMLASILLNEVTMRYAVPARFMTIYDYLELTKKSYNEAVDLKSLEMAPVLVIDDIGAQMAKEWVDTVLFKLIDKRYANRLVTIYTSNKRIDELKMDERIIDRIDSQSITIHLPEESIRSRQIQTNHDDFMAQFKED